MDGLKALRKGLEVADIVGLVLGDVHGEVAVCHLAQDAPHVIDGLSKAAAHPVGGLGDHADLVRAAVEGLQLLVGGEVQVPKAANGPLYHHELPALPAQEQQRQKYDGGGHGGAKDAHQNAHARHRGEDLRGVVPDHKDPAPVLQVLIDHQLLHVVLVTIGVCIGLGAAVGLYALDYLKIPGVCGLCIEKLLVLVVEVHPGVHVQKHVFTVGQALDVKVQKRVHQVAGIDPGAHVADALLPLEYGVVHGQYHAAGARGLHYAQIRQLLPG